MRRLTLQLDESCWREAIWDISVGCRETMKTIEAKNKAAPPQWALMQRLLIEVMNRAAVAFVERYTRRDGTLVWRDEWPGMDGSDDAYESFSSFPLFYALGGSACVHELARKEWNAITRQFTEYGQVYNEFDAYFDWMHHGESYLYIYHFGLAEPNVEEDRARALRFAGMYMGEGQTGNWDAVRRLIRSPLNGSRGPRLEMSARDWLTGRPILADYLSPYEDVPAVAGSEDPFAKADWNDDRVFQSILDLMNRRMARGDVPLNLTSTSLITNAYLYTGEERYRQWVLDYLNAWVERTKANSGIVPDNVGLSGEIGECMDGKWWGGYYGWRWPHGAMNLLESTLVSGSNALLMTGDSAHLGLLRSQLDLLHSLGKSESSALRVPWRHGDNGWFDFRPPDSRLYIHLYHLSQSEEDLQRLNEIADYESWETCGGFGKGAQTHPGPWLAYVQGRNPGYPEQALSAEYAEISRRLTMIRNDRGDPREYGIHHWQDLNPVVCEGLLQMTMGTPGVIYHGGLLHACVRHFDPERRRPGLPEHVAALVERVSSNGIIISLVNTDPLAAHDLVMQAGAFGEHEFADAVVLNAADNVPSQHCICAKHLQVRLAPAAQLRLDIGMKRYRNQPSYGLPWE